VKRVFISYSRIDVEFARSLASALSNAGADVWIDVEDIPAGMKWSRAIQQGLDTAEAMLVVISPESVDSHNVEDEWQYFMDQGKPVIPILWRPAKMPFQLNRLQYIDFQAQSFDSAFSQLIGELNRRGVQLNQPSHIPQVAATPQPKPITPTQTQSQRLNRMPLIVGLFLVAIVIAGAGLLLPGMLADRPSELSEFVADPLPGVLLNGNGTVVVHEDASGTSSADRTFSRAEITLRIEDDAIDEYWYQLEAPDGETGYQITENLLAAGVVVDILLAVVPLSINFSADERDISLYLSPDPDSGWIDLEIEPNIAVIGYTIDEEGTVWWLIEAGVESDGELVRGWYAGDSTVFGNVPVITTLPDDVTLYVNYEETMAEVRDAEAVGELPAWTDVHVLYYEVQERGDDAALIATYNSISDAWEAYWIIGDALELNDNTIDTLEEYPVFEP